MIQDERHMHSELGSQAAERLLGAVTMHQISIAPQAMNALRQLCTADLTNGGRGIRNKIEAHLINPLARALFDRERGGPAVVRSLAADTITSLALEDA